MSELNVIYFHISRSSESDLTISEWNPLNHTVYVRPYTLPLNSAFTFTSKCSVFFHTRGMLLEHHGDGTLTHSPPRLGIYFLLRSQNLFPLLSQRPSEFLALNVKLWPIDYGLRLKKVSGKSKGKFKGGGRLLGSDHCSKKTKTRRGEKRKKTKKQRAKQRLSSNLSSRTGEVLESQGWRKTGEEADKWEGDREY